MSATTGILCIGHHIPYGGLSKNMLRLDVPLHQHDVYIAAGNQADEIAIQCQKFWIAEAIRYTHQQAVESMFAEGHRASTKYPTFPSVERLSPRKTPNFGLGPILENEGTIEGTFQVIDKIFLQQLGLDAANHFNQRLQLVYGDQKTVSLIGSVKRERKHSRNVYGRYDWLLPVPGLFHWRTNFMDMIYDVYSGSESSFATIETTLLHNERYMGCDRGHKSPFHHKEEVATRAFNARITAMFYDRIRNDCQVNDYKALDEYISTLSTTRFLGHVDAIRRAVFDRSGQYVPPVTDPTIDHVFVAHCRFINQMETYRSLKHAIKHGDIGIIERIFPRCCLLFHGANKTKYGFLSLYMTWLTHTKAASHQLRTALLANSLVNLRGTHDGWFEMDRLNEFLNLKLKTLMIFRRTSTQLPHDLFRRFCLTASYSADLRDILEKAFGEHSNPRHQDKDASTDVYRLAYELYKSGSTTRVNTGRDTPFKPVDILHKALGDPLDMKITAFNASQYPDGDNAHTPSIDDLVDIMDDDNEIDLDPDL